MLYAHTKENKVYKITGKPKWFFDDGTQVDDTYLKNEGIFPVQENNPDYNRLTHKIVEKDITDWIIGDNFVEKTYNIIEITDKEAERISHLYINIFPTVNNYITKPVNNTTEPVTERPLRLAAKKARLA